jgi:hypothetical protein
VAANKRRKTPQDNTDNESEPEKRSLLMMSSGSDSDDLFELAPPRARRIIKPDRYGIASSTLAERVKLKTRASLRGGTSKNSGSPVMTKMTPVARDKSPGNKSRCKR